MNSRARLVGCCLTVGLFSGLLYINSLGNQFTNWDDQMIYSNYSIRSLDWENLLALFTPVHGSTYQPVRVLSYGIDYHFWKLNPVGYHLSNILFYVLTCLFVFLILKEISNHLRPEAPPESHGRVALFGGLLFAAHPVHVEAVAWLAARKEVLQGFFLFLAFFLYLRVRGGEVRAKRTYLVLVLLSFLLAVLSKPSAIVFPGLILVYEVARGRDQWIGFIRSHKLFLLLSLGISCVFTVILIKVMLDAGGVKPFWGGSLFNNFLVTFYAFAYNIKLLFFTLNYSAAYTIPLPSPILGLRTLFFIAVTALLWLLSLWSLKKTRVFFFSFFFFLVAVSPFLNVIPISTLLADRYVFVASFTYAFLVGTLLDWLFAYRHPKMSEGFFKLLTVCLFFMLLAAYSFMTLRQNTLWENSYTLWSDAVEKYPDSNTANALMGVVYVQAGMYEEAVPYLEKAIQVLPYDYQSRNNLGIALGRLNQTQRAIREFLTAIGLKPEEDSFKINLATLYQRVGEYRKAEELFDYLLEKNPKDAYMHYRKALVCKEAGNYVKAVSEFELASALAPQIINPLEQLGYIYLGHFKDLEKAKGYFARATEAAPKGSPQKEEMRRVFQDIER